MLRLERRRIRRARNRDALLFMLNQSSSCSDPTRFVKCRAQNWTMLLCFRIEDWIYFQMKHALDSYQSISTHSTLSFNLVIQVLKLCLVAWTVPISRQGFHTDRGLSKSSVTFQSPAHGGSRDTCDTSPCSSFI